jgi:hypothetical protein
MYATRVTVVIDSMRGHTHVGPLNMVTLTVGSLELYQRYNLIQNFNKFTSLSSITAQVMLSTRPS